MALNEKKFDKKMLIMIPESFIENKVFLRDFMSKIFTHPETRITFDGETFQVYEDGVMEPQIASVPTIATITPTTPIVERPKSPMNNFTQEEIMSMTPDEKRALGLAVTTDMTFKDIDVNHRAKKPPVSTAERKARFGLIGASNAGTPEEAKEFKAAIGAAGL